MHSPLTTLIGVAIALALAGPYIVLTVGERRYRKDVARRCAMRAAGTPPPPPPLPARRALEQMSWLRRRLIRNADAAFARSSARYEAEKLRARRGFSLIELAVVLIVIGVIAAIAAPTFQGVIQRASERAELTQVTHAMRNAVALAAINERLNPTPEDIAQAFEDLDPDAVVVLAGDPVPAPGVRTLTVVLSETAAEVVEPSSVRPGECVVGRAEARTVTARYISPTETGATAAVCADHVDDAEVETGGGGEPAGLIAPDGTDCALAVPWPQDDGGFSWGPELGWVPAAAVGCVPLVTVGRDALCPKFGPIGGEWYTGKAAGGPFAGSGTITVDEIAAGIGCVPRTDFIPIMEPYAWCYSRPDWTLKWTEWLAGERCQAGESVDPWTGAP